MQLTRRDALSATAIAGLAAGMAHAEPVKSSKAKSDTTESMPGHVVLLGDSIFDNKSYVKPGPPVIDQLRKALPAGWKATLLARDGSVAGQVYLQLERLPADATHLIVSTGGNDALQQQDILEKRVATVSDALAALSTLREKFATTYARMLEALLAAKRPAMVCTIYDPNFKDLQQQRVCVSALTLYNDCIHRAAALRHFPLLDLRQIFRAPADYANPIEPSVIGGQKLATHITRIVQHHDFNSNNAVMFGAPSATQ